MPLLLDDIQVGQKIRTAEKKISRDSIIEFAKKYDPQPMHLTDEGAKGTIFGQLVASGWQVFAETMRLIVDEDPFEGTPLIGHSVTDCKMFKPLLPEESIYVESEVLSKRPSSNPQKPLGYVEIFSVTYTSDGEKLAQQRWSVAVPRKI